MLATEYGALEFTLWLLLAALVGFAIGWLIRNWLLDKQKAEEIAAIRSEEEATRHKIEAERDEAQSKVASLTADLDLRTADVERANKSIAEHGQTIEQLEADIAAAQSEVGKSEAKVQDRESTIAALRDEVGKERDALASLRQDTEDYQSTIESLRADLDAERRKHEGLEATIAAAADTGGELEALRADLDTARRDRDDVAAKLAELEEEHADCAAKLEAAEEAATTVVIDLPDKDVAVAKVAEIASRTRGEGPAVEDDLKLIHGVGPKLERLLKSMDITSFRQVANFTADDIQYVTAALDAFPGRIERDDWMSSAAEEHAKKYGAPV